MKGFTDHIIDQRKLEGLCLSLKFVWNRIPDTKQEITVPRCYLYTPAQISNRDLRSWLSKAMLINQKTRAMVI